MFNLVPFERRQRDLSNFFDWLEKNFFGNMLDSMAEFRTGSRPKSAGSTSNSRRRFNANAQNEKASVAAGDKLPIE